MSSDSEKEDMSDCSTEEDSSVDLNDGTRMNE